LAAALYTRVLFPIVSLGDSLDFATSLEGFAGSALVGFLSDLLDFG
jgi:hypothetical protein